MECLYICSHHSCGLDLGYDFLFAPLILRMDCKEVVVGVIHDHVLYLFLLHLDSTAWALVSQIVLLQTHRDNFGAYPVLKIVVS